MHLQGDYNLLNKLTQQLLGVDLDTIKKIKKTCIYTKLKNKPASLQSNWYRLSNDWDAVINQSNLYQDIIGEIPALEIINGAEAENYIENYLLPPMGSQEVWAAGVTYLRSRDARMEESEDTGAADCYQRVYREAERPELFFKSLPHRVAGHKQEVRIRKDSTWNMPEPSLLYSSTTKEISRHIRLATT